MNSPMCTVLARAFDRQHALKLVELGVDYQMRETFESALAMGPRGGNPAG
jgi:glutathione-regulated potassium-efflux system protein KefB